MTRMVGLLFFLAVSWRADAQHLRGRVVQNDLFRGLVGSVDTSSTFFLNNDVQYCTYNCIML